MTISMTRLVPQPLGLHGASRAILVGVASNTVTKVVIGMLIGRGRFAAAIAAMALGCIVAGWLAFVATAALLHTS
jgi:uncharacterized membrane protein (DUF4010 family)